MSNEPSEIRAGDSVSWTVSLADYSAADGWSLKYALAGRGGIIAEKTASASGSDFVCAFTKAETEALAAGDYFLAERVEKDADAVTVFHGRVEILRNLLSATAPVDARKHCEKVLDAIEALLEKRASTDQENITINGESLGRTSIPDLLTLRAQYKREVAQLKRAERLAAGQGNKNKILVRFS